MIYQALFLLTWTLLLQTTHQLNLKPTLCGNSQHSKKLKFVHGDALSDSSDCIGPDGTPYPKDAIENMIEDMDLKRFKPVLAQLGRQSRMMSEFSDQSRENKAMDVSVTRDTLLRSYQQVNSLESFDEALERHKRAVKSDSKSKKEQESKVDEKKRDETTYEENNNQNKDMGGATCKEAGMIPSRMCKTSYNTTAPMYGVSLTSGKPVTIVQKFPDLLQQVVYETCERKACALLQGECVQTYIPYLFLVIPLGPVTLTGQDYVLVESGCTCRPKDSHQLDPNPADIIPDFS